MGAMAGHWCLAVWAYFVGFAGHSVVVCVITLQIYEFCLYLQNRSHFKTWRGNWPKRLVDCWFGLFLACLGLANGPFCACQKPQNGLNGLVCGVLMMKFPFAKKSGNLQLLVI